MALRYSEEQIALANSVNIHDFLLSQGETVRRSGKDVRWQRYSSVTINGNRYYHWKVNKGGYPIQFLEEFYGYNFKQSMEMLLSFASDIGLTLDAPVEHVEQRKEFELPERNDTMKRVYGYLMHTRFIDKDVIDEFVKHGLIYEDTKHHAIFVGYDEDGIAKHAHKKSTSTYGNYQYRGNVESSDANYSFHYNGNDNSVYVFEAPIDMLSYITLNNEDWKEHNYVALNGLGTMGLEHLLDVYPNIKSVYLCFDHDIAGIEGAERVLDLMMERTILDTTIIQPKNKDFNEDLKEIHDEECIKGLENMKTIEMKQAIDEIQYMIMLDNKEYHYKPDVYEGIRALFESYHSNTTYNQNDYYKINDLIDDLFKSTLTIEYALLNNYENITNSSDVFKVLKKEYRSYKDTGNMSKIMNDLVRHFTDIDIAYSRDKSIKEVVRAYRDFTNSLLYMKLQIRREILKMEFKDETQGLEESQRPDAKIIGEDGNIFNVMGIASKSLKQAGYKEKADEMFHRVTSSGSYNEALSIITEYVNPVGEDIEMDEDPTMNMDGYR